MSATQTQQQKATTLDPRLMQVSFQVNNNLNTFDQEFSIKARGTKFANPLQNECQVEIANLDKVTRNYILTETSPFNANRTPKILNLYAGRVSTGVFLVYTGNITVSKVSQPPDIILTLKCGTGHFLKGKVGSRSGGANQKLSMIASGVASNMGLSLNNQADDRTIANYSHNGSAYDEVAKLQQFGVNAYVDDNQLVLKEVGVPLKGSLLVLSDTTGMIGIPEVTEKGLKVTFLFDNNAKLGGAIQIVSKLNPATNGIYVIYKLNFALSSRDNEFYYIAECLKAKT